MSEPRLWEAGCLAPGDTASKGRSCSGPSRMPPKLVFFPNPLLMDSFPQRDPVEPEMVTRRQGWGGGTHLSCWETCLCKACAPSATNPCTQPCNSITSCHPGATMGTPSPQTTLSGREGPTAPDISPRTCMRLSRRPSGRRCQSVGPGRGHRDLPLHPYPGSGLGPAPPQEERERTWLKHALRKGPLALEWGSANFL